MQVNSFTVQIIGKTLMEELSLDLIFKMYFTAILFQLCMFSMKTFTSVFLRNTMHDIFEGSYPEGLFYTKT